MLAKIMVLGVYHFGDEGEHLITTKSKDIMSDEKQEELKEVLKRIKKFKPTKIAIEVFRDKDDEINDIFRYYLKNERLKENDIISEKSEVFQLAFPLAKELKHEKIYALDYPVDLPTEVLQYAEGNDPKLFNEFMRDAQAIELEINNKLQNDSVLDILKYLNDPKRVSAEHSNLYLRMAQIGSGTTYDGVSTLSEWYKRNIYIYCNLQSMLDEGDRVLMIYGAGHIKILSELIRNYDDMELEDTMMYLG